jgi:hypothetical protein
MFPYFKCEYFFFQVDQSPSFINRLSPPRPTTLMIDNGQEMEMDTDFRDCENNQILNHNNSNKNLQRNRKKKKRAADIPVKKFNGKFINIKYIIYYQEISFKSLQIKFSYLFYF